MDGPSTTSSHEDTQTSDRVNQVSAKTQSSGGYDAALYSIRNPSYLNQDMTHLDDTSQREDSVKPKPRIIYLNHMQSDDDKKDIDHKVEGEARDIEPASKTKSPEDSAEEALDSLVVILYHHPEYYLKSKNHDFGSLGERLHRFGRALLSQLSPRKRRRLAAGDSDSSHSPRDLVKQRLARRLTQYIQLGRSFYSSHRDDTQPSVNVAAFTNLFSSSETDKDATIGTSYPPDQVPDLGYAESTTNDCIYSQYINQDLKDGCLEAVDRYLKYTATAPKSRPETPTPQVEPKPARMLSELITITEEDTELLHNEQKAKSIMCGHFLYVVCLLSILPIAASCSSCYLHTWLLAFLVVLCSIAGYFFGWVALLILVPVVIFVDLLYEISCYCRRKRGSDETAFDCIYLSDQDSDTSTCVKFGGQPVHVV